MIKKAFENIAKEVNGTYEHSEFRHVSLTSRDIPTSFHSLSVVHLNIPIDLVFEFGGHNMATVNSSIAVQKTVPAFTVTTKSQMSRLFSKKKHPFTVKSEDQNFTSTINQFLSVSKYKEIAQKTTFEPQIHGEMEDGVYTINTSFYLGFDDKEKAIIPSLNLHRKFIEILS
ncbi:MAG: hypothetical protein ACFHU9_05965 [Fluviicola sp.]